jgi:sporulation protein YhbH
MSIFKEHKTIADRSASDRRRHKQKIEKAIREGIHHIVADESIIGQDGKKKFRIPVKGIKEYKFVYGANNGNKQVGSAPGKDVKRGQKIGEDDQQGAGKPKKAGKDKGEEYYDVEITLEELAQYLFDELQLPELQKRQLSNINIEKLKRKGYRPDGILPRLDKKKSAIARIKRMKAAGFNPEEAEEGETFSFHDDDLKYRHFKMTPKPCTNAVIFFIMDVSGSMTQDKKFLARSFFFLLYQFIRTKYDTVEVVFITHDTEAREVEEKEFFTEATSGGTIASSALVLASEIMEKRYHPTAWNIYLFQASDGDNFSSDNEKFVNEARKLAQICQLYGYCEIEPERYYNQDKLYTTLQLVTGTKVKTVRVVEKSDVWQAFRALMGGKGVSLTKE